LNNAPLRAAPGSKPIWTLLLILLLAGLEYLFFAWYLSEPLPNAPSTGGEPIRRSILLWEAVPGIKPGMPAGRALLYLAAGEFRHVENLPQRIPIVLAASLIAGAAIAAGRMVLRALRLLPALGRWERPALAFGVGASALGIMTLILGRLGWLAPWPIRIGLGALILLESGWTMLAGGRRIARIPPGFDQDSLSNPQATGLSPHRLAPILAFALVAGPFLVIMALAAMLPTYDYDAIEYHLEGPKEYYQAGRIAFLDHNVYTSMPFSIEMLHLLGMVVLDDWWWGALAGQLLVACFAPAAAVLVALSALRWGSARAAWVAAVVYLSTPWIYRIALFPYVEGPLCYYHAALVWAAARAWTIDPILRARCWALVGLLAGGAMACKYPALISAVAPFGLLATVAAVRQKAWPIVVAFGLGVALVIGAWLVKNVIDTGNPVYPLAYRVFGGRSWDEDREAKWNAAHGPKPISARALGDGLLDIAGRSDWQSPLYAALAPLALLRRGSRRQALLLFGYVAYIFMTWWLLTHRLDRFWLPLLPPAAVLAGLGADWVRSYVWTAVLVTVLAAGISSNLVFDSTSLAGFGEWTGDLINLRTRVPRSLNPPLARLDTELPPGAKVLLVGQAAVFHFNHPVVYNTVFNQDILETLTRGPSPRQPFRDPALVREDLVRRGIDYVYVDWREIDRFRSPGNYGFTAFVTPAVLDSLVRGGALEPPSLIGHQQELYRVRKPNSDPR
jgi:hypothetical protein